VICLLVIAKAPVPGLAKTRLCPPATQQQAADIAAASLMDTLAAVADVDDATAVVALTGDLNGASHREDLKRAMADMTVIWQRGDGLAGRLANAHLDVAALFPGLPVLQIGMDTPQLRPGILADAAGRLAEFDAVLGPAADGGWWGLGLRDPADADVLRDIPTSRSDTGDRTMLALRGKGLRVDTLHTLSDVDTMADAVRVAAEVPGSRFAASVATVAADTVAADTVAADTVAATC
jgi:glycosyltransferase A (GT-A) superfamily protein (DUF2064 family)